MRRSQVLRSEAFVAHQDLLAGLRPLGRAELRAKDSILFRQGEASRGGYLLEAGEAKLLFSDDDGKTVTIRTVGPGYVLGLPGTIINREYLFTAKLTRDSRVTFIASDVLLDFLRRRSDLCFDIVEMLGGELLDLPHTVLKRMKRTKARTNA